MRLWLGSMLNGLLMAAAAAAWADGNDYLDACARKGDNGKLEESIDLCTRAIHSGDLSARNLIVAYVNRSISYRGLHRFDEAIADCTQALSLRADSFDAHLACANAYGGKGDFDSAFGHYDAAQKLEPDEAVVYNNRANHLNQIGEYERALKELDTALRLDSDYELALINRGAVLFNLGRFPEAVKALEVAVDEDSENAYALLWLTMARRHAGIDVKSADLMTAAEDIDRKAWPWPIIAAFAGEKVGFAEALRFGDGAVEAGTTVNADQDCEASFYFGEMAVLSGETAEARQRLQHAADTCTKTFIEHAGALAELKRM